jgi:hypothetical protein
MIGTCTNLRPFLDAKSSKDCGACYRKITEAEIRGMNQADIENEMRRAGERDVDIRGGYWNIADGKTYFGSDYGNKITNDQSWNPSSTLCVPCDNFLTWQDNAGNTRTQCTADLTGPLDTSCLYVTPFLDAKGSTNCPQCYQPITEDQLRSIDPEYIKFAMVNAGESPGDLKSGYWRIADNKTYFGSDYGNKITNDQSWNPSSTLCVPVPDCSKARSVYVVPSKSCPTCYRSATEEDVNKIGNYAILKELKRLKYSDDQLKTGVWRLADGKTYLGWGNGNKVVQNPTLDSGHSLCVPAAQPAVQPGAPTQPGAPGFTPPTPAPAAVPCPQRPVLHYAQGSTTCPPCYNLIPEARMLQILKNNRQPLLNFMSRSGATPAELQSGSWNIAGGKQLTGAVQGFNIVDGRRPAPSSLCINPYFKPVAKPVPKPVAKPVPKPVAKVTPPLSRAIARR